MGEFEGEDAGTPLTVRAVTTTVAVDRWAHRAADVGRPLAPGDLLEPLVEAENPSGDGLGPGLRPRAEAGAALLAAITELGLADTVAVRDALLASLPLERDPAAHPGGAAADLDPAWSRLLALLGDRALVDGELACQAWETAGGLPAFLPPLAADDAGAVAGGVDGLGGLVPGRGVTAAGRGGVVGR